MDPKTLKHVAQDEGDAFTPAIATGWEQLVRTHQAGLLRFATRLTGNAETAQDVVQETFLRMLKENRLREYPEGVRCWLFRVCRNLCADHARKESRMQKRQRKVAVPDTVPAEPSRWERQEQSHKVQDLLLTIPEAEREVLLLKIQHGHSYREISKITGLSLHQVGKHVHQGLHRLATQFRAAGLV